jgi:hypothetical protein
LQGRHQDGIHQLTLSELFTNRIGQDNRYEQPPMAQTGNGLPLRSPAGTTVCPFG